MSEIVFSRPVGIETVEEFGGVEVFHHRDADGLNTLVGVRQETHHPFRRNQPTRQGQDFALKEINGALLGGARIVGIGDALLVGCFVVGKRSSDLVGDVHAITIELVDHFSVHV